MTDQELIIKLKSLKHISPNKDWVVFTKSKIIQANPETVKRKINFSFFFAPKLSYVFSAMFLALIGVFGFAQYTLPGDVLFSVKKITEQSQASLLGENTLQTSVENFKKRSQDLAQVIKDKKEVNKSAAAKEVNEAAKTLTDAIVKNPTLAKDIAMELKNNGTLAVIKEGDGVKEMYKTLLGQLIKDQEEISFTDENKKIFDEVKELYAKEDYIAAFEKNLELNIDTISDTDN